MAVRAGGRWSPVAGGALALVIVTVLLTYSRGGVLALAMASGVTVAFLPRRTPPLMALVAAAIGAAWPVAYALSDPLLNADRVPVDLREGAGAGLGWRLAVGVAWPPR